MQNRKRKKHLYLNFYGGYPGRWLTHQSPADRVQDRHDQPLIGVAEYLDHKQSQDAPADVAFRLCDWLCNNQKGHG